MFDPDYAKWQGIANAIRGEIRNLRKFLNHGKSLGHYGVYGLAENEAIRSFEAMRADVERLPELIERITVLFQEAENQRAILLAKAEGKS